MKYIQQKTKILKLLQKEQKDKAIDLLEKEISANIDSGINSLILSELFINEKDDEDAIAILEQILPKIHLFTETIQYEILENLGNLYLKNYNYQKAYFYLNKAYNLKKTQQLLAKLGQIYLEVDKIKPANKIFTYLTNQKPQNDDYKCLLGYYFIKSGEDQKAEKIFMDILDRNNSHEAANFYFGYYFFTKKIYDSAIEHFEKIKKTSELKYKCNYYTALIWQIKNDRSKAIDFFTSCLKNVIYENQITLDMRYNMASLYEQALDYQSALEQLKIIYKYAPDYRDIAQKLISENYQKIKSTFLLDYNTLANNDFIKYGKKIIELLNFRVIKSVFLDKNNILIFQCESTKPGKISNLVNGNFIFKMKQPVLVLFFRLIHIRGNMLTDILKKITFPFETGVLVSSGLVSPLTVHDAHNNNITVILPTQLNKIIQKHPIK